jgi:hypothetical protein
MDRHELSFSTGARSGASNRFPDGSLDFFESTDFSIDCPSVSLLDQIAKGSYGTVYKGMMNGNIVAVKMEDFHEDAEEQVNLLIELSMLQSYPHKNLVKFFGAGFLPKSATGEMVVHSTFVFQLFHFLLQYYVDCDDCVGVVQTWSIERMSQIQSALECPRSNCS